MVPRWLAVPTLATNATGDGSGCPGAGGEAKAGLVLRPCGPK